MLSFLSASAAPPPAPHPSATPAHYVVVPRRLLLDLRDAPAATGAFALLARVYRATGQPVPLSPGDLQAYDPALSYGAATRALQRLVATGWLLAARRPGHKTTYTPAWGLVRGAALPWDLAAPCLGRPRHIAALRLDQQLLDVCMGRLDPHPDHPALVRRYMEAPLLGLREVGIYALALAGLPATSPRLEELRFIEGGRPQPLPDEATILAVVSQRGGHALSPEGWRRTPFGGAAQPAPEDTAPGQTLFFVPPGQIGTMIGGVIAGPITISAVPTPLPPASESHKLPTTDPLAGSHGSMKGMEHTTTGGGDYCNARTTEQAPGEPAPSAPQTTSHTLLLAARVNARVAAELADAPAALVERTIALARSTPGVRDQARWIVGVLRDWKAKGWPADDPPAPPARVSDSPILFYEGISGRERQIWLNRFRAADPADRQSVLDRFFTEVGHVPSS